MLKMKAAIFVEPGRIVLDEKPMERGGQAGLHSSCCRACSMAVRTSSIHSGRSIPWRRTLRSLTGASACTANRTRMGVPGTTSTRHLRTVSKSCCPLSPILLREGRCQNAQDVGAHSGRSRRCRWSEAIPAAWPPKGINASARSRFGLGPHQPSGGERIAGCCEGGRIVENAPGFDAGGRILCGQRCNGSSILRAVGRVVDLGRAMQTIARQGVPTARLVSSWNRSRIRSPGRSEARRTVLLPRARTRRHDEARKRCHPRPGSSARLGSRLRCQAGSSGLGQLDQQRPELGPESSCLRQKPIQ